MAGGCGHISLYTHRKVSEFHLKRLLLLELRREGRDLYGRAMKYDSLLCKQEAYRLLVIRGHLVMFKEQQSGPSDLRKHPKWLSDH